VAYFFIELPYCICERGGGNKEKESKKKRKKERKEKVKDKFPYFEAEFKGVLQLEIAKMVIYSIMF
jgi:hypothetical protein